MALSNGGRSPNTSQMTAVRLKILTTVITRVSVEPRSGSTFSLMAIRVAKVAARLNGLSEDV